MSGHSVLAPSSAHRLIQCPGFLSLSRQCPPDPTGGHESLEGQAAHWVVAQTLHGVILDVGSATPWSEFPVTQEMLDGADLMLEDIQKACAAEGVTMAQVWVEQPVCLRALDPACWGTPDAMLVVRRPDGTYRVYVWDYKYGHKYVPVVSNWQLVAYSAGGVHAIELQEPGAESKIGVVLTIVQPRAYHRNGPVRTWPTTATNLRASYNLLSNAFREAQQGGTLRAGDACRHCHCVGVCPQAVHAENDVLDFIEEPVPLEMDARAVATRLARVQKALEILKAVDAGLSEQALHFIRSGQNVPGYHVATSVGRETWKAPAETVLSTAAMMGVQVDRSRLLRPPELVTPAQARKAGLPAAITDTFSHRPPGALSLQRLTEEAVSLTFKNG